MIYTRIVILTGAGVSADSGVDTFRDPNGVWSQYDWQEVATPDGFARNPAMVHDFYNMRRAGLAEAAPNAAHTALARLERDADAEVLIVTQNVDDLHKRAGTSNIIHMHGEMKKVRCQCDGHVLACLTDLSVNTPCPQCGKIGCLRPHVVWFGEMPFSMDRIAQALADCDLFVSIGTSGNVYPAAGFVAEVRAKARAHTVEINLEPSEGHSHFEETVYGRAADTVPAFVDRLLG